jgi:hypothetical protein
MSFDKREYQRQYMERKRAESNKESNNSEVVLDKMLDNPVRQVDGRHDHECLCGRVWSCSYVSEAGTCWRDDFCLACTPTLPPSGSVSDHLDWTRAYNAIRVGIDRQKANERESR